MTAQRKSSYNSQYRGKQTSGERKPASNDGAKEKTPPTHSMYRLERDDEGNVTEKVYANGVFVYEEEGKFGPILNINVLEDIPAGRWHLVRRKGM